MRGGRRSLTAAEQLWQLRRSPIAIGDGVAKGGQLDWRFAASPTPVARTYQLRLRLTPQGRLSVVVEDPNLVALARGRKLPHVYREQPVELCLFHPRYGEWDTTMRLDLTVVPWAYLWLFYFEDWLVTGDWQGGGEHPTRLRQPAGRNGHSAPLSTTLRRRPG